MKMMDYFYCEDGRVLMNLGIEGITFTITPDGKYKYTELITNDPGGLSLDRAISKYTPAGVSFRLYQDRRYWEQMMAYENQRETLDLLISATTERQLPLVSPTPEESSRFASIQNDINTYRSEMFARFILGQADINSNWDTYVNTIKSLNIEEATRIQQAGVDRYFRR